MNVAVKTPSVIQRNAAGEPPLGSEGAFFRDDQGCIFRHPVESYRSGATDIGILELDNGEWLAKPPSFNVTRPRYPNGESALRAAICAMVRRARKYMRNKDGCGTQWSEGFAGRVIEWVLSLKPEPSKMRSPSDQVNQGATDVAAIPRGHPGLAGDAAISGAGVTDDVPGKLAGAVIQPSDPIVTELMVAKRARREYPAGHTFGMTNPVINGQMVTLGTCSCGDSFSYPYGSAGHEKMDAAIEAHWQKFDASPDKVDGRGQPINEINAEDGSDVSTPTPRTTRRAGKRNERSAPKTGGAPGPANAALPEPASANASRVDGAGSPEIQNDAGMPAVAPPSQGAKAGGLPASAPASSARLAADGAGVADAKCKTCEPAPIGAPCKEVSEPPVYEPLSNAEKDPDREAGLGGGSLALSMAAEPTDDWSPLLSAALDMAWREPAPIVGCEDDFADPIEPDPLPMPTAEELKALSSANVSILIGDCRDLMKTLPANSIQCVITSPPYWGLRDYGIDPSIWGGSPDCMHEWGDAVRAANANNVPGPNGLGGKNGNGHRNTNKEAGSYCAHCDAWRGAFGLEPDYQMFVDHAVEIFREVKRVLRPDGTVWLNIGDSYATGAGRVGVSPGGGEQGERWRGGHEGKHGSSWFDQPPPGESSQFADRKVSGIGPMTQPNRMPQIGLKSKDLCGIPWRVAFALQADGWWLRQDVIWSKPNPMPESTRDRCTKAHEYIFLLSKSERYFYDADAIAEDAQKPDGPEQSSHKYQAAYDAGDGKHRTKASLVDIGARDTRNKRSVWEVATQPFPEAHFATFPPALIEPCVLASTSARGACISCGAGWQRITRKVETGKTQKMPDGMATYAGGHTAIHKEGREKGTGDNAVMAAETIGWYPSCKCEGLPPLPPHPAKPSRARLGDEAAYKAAIIDHRIACAAIDGERAKLCAETMDRETLRPMVLDPFGGAGTTGLVADRLKRRAILTERNPAYAAIASKRIKRDAGIFASVEQIETVDTPPSLLDVMASES